MISLMDQYNVAPTDSSLALYRGIKVAVYKVDKTELHLTRNDLVELVNVSRSSTVLLNCNKANVRHAAWLSNFLAKLGGATKWSEKVAQLCCVSDIGPE